MWPHAIHNSFSSYYAIITFTLFPFSRIQGIRRVADCRPLRKTERRRRVGCVLYVGVCVSESGYGLIPYSYSVMGVRRCERRDFLPHTTILSLAYSKWESETHVVEHYIYHHNINANKSERRADSNRKTLTSINLNLLFNFLATKVHSHTSRRVYSHSYTSTDTHAHMHPVCGVSCRFLCSCGNGKNVSATSEHVIMIIIIIIAVRQLHSLWGMCVIGRAVIWVSSVYSLPFEFGFVLSISLGKQQSNCIRRRKAFGFTLKV